MFNKFLAIFIIISIIVSGFGSQSAQAEEDYKYFIVTAYYSPLPNQSKYIMGSYEAEVRMNGQGYRGAGGKKVFSGMLAAPKIYNFGTKIYLEGLGIGEVADRGGAIVKAGERNFKHDRIDLWVGHGEEGLQRAMYWGKRTIRGKIVKKGNIPNISIKRLAAPKWTTAYLPTSNSYTPKNEEYHFFNYGIGTKSKKENILALQEFLKKINFYKGTVNGIYNHALMNAIYAFQKENNIVSNWSNIHAGYWSYKTRDLLWEKYTAGEFKTKENTPTITQSKITEEKISLISQKSSTHLPVHSQTEELIDIFTQKVFNREGVKRLQRILKKLGYYKGEISGEYSDVRESVLQFQIKNKIVKTKSSPGAGNYGPTTRKTLQREYADYGIIKEREKVIEKQKIKQTLKDTAITTKRIKKLGNIKSGHISLQVREFQIILKELGFFSYKDTAIFGPKTTQALITYQLDRNIISDASVYGAGLLGPKTKKQLIIDLTKQKIK